MPVPAAPAALPLTVLVLAWDEAAPAVRTLVAAAPGLAPASLGPLLVLVPPTPPAEAATPASVTSEPDPAATEPAQTAAALPEASSVPPAATFPALQPTTVAAFPTESVARPGASSISTTSATSAGAGTEAVAPAAAEALPIRPAATRVVHLVYTALSDVSLLAGQGPGREPAAPYLGATPPVASPRPIGEGGTYAIEAAATSETVPNTPGAAQFPKLPQALGAAMVVFPGAPESAQPPLAEAYTTEVAQAPDLEADLQPEPGADPDEALLPLAPAPAGPPDFAVADQAVAVPVAEMPVADLPAPAEAEASTEADERADLLAGASLTGRETATNASFAFEQQPTETNLEPEHNAVTSPPLAPVAASYPAPDLNVQVIRYARYAVPAALAEGPFNVLYAPAWPTWLAALELRQRTGCPLVLHLPALAAGREPADVAAGWPAEIQRQALRQADLVLTETYALARRLRRELGLASTTVRVVPAADGAAVARALRRAHCR